MPSRLALNEPIIAEAMKLGRFKSKAEAINVVLAEYIRRKKQASIIELFGKIDYYPDYDYKKLRSRKNMYSPWLAGGNDSYPHISIQSLPTQQN